MSDVKTRNELVSQLKLKPADRIVKSISAGVEIQPIVIELPGFIMKSLHVINSPYNYIYCTCFAGTSWTFSSFPVRAYTP